MIENLDGVAPHFLLGYLWATMKADLVITPEEWNKGVLKAREEATRRHGENDQ